MINEKMAQKSPYYICDYCKEKINDISDATFQWLYPIDDKTIGMQKASDFKIIHNYCTCFREDTSKLSDRNFSSNYEDIVMMILQMLSDDIVAKPEEAYEILKRLTITDYEIVSQYIKQAEIDGVFEPNSKESYPTSSQIRLIKEHYLSK